VGLAGEEMKMPDQLSGGMRKRVGLARTIVSRPACILYDEPTTGLDPIATDSINHLIRRLQERLRVTSVVVTHDMRTAFHTADHLVFLHEGTVYAQGSPEEVRGSKDPVLRDFIEGRSREG
jgi:phospholipid/cholesterol/gamma-HCH transport system ATP-binding protein